MPKPPKFHYSDEETQRYINEYTPYLQRPYVPVNAARGVVRALLDQIQIQNLNRQAAEDHLMAELLHDNKILEDAEKGSEDFIISEDQSPEERAKSQAFIADILLSSRGNDRVRKVLQEYSHHSSDQMRAESDEVLKAIAAHPFSNYRDLSEWGDANLPRILRSLKNKHSCSTACAGYTDWPPLERILPKDNDTGVYGAAAVKNCILAYFHNLSVSSVENYLEGQKPKV